MRLLRPIRLFLALVALTAASTITSAQDASFFDPKKSVSDGQPVHDNALLVPLNGQLASNRIDVLLLPSKLRSRQQVPTCATNYTVCQGFDFCCPEGNACCPGGTCCGAGTYCTTVGGVQGCCKINHVCNQLANECTVQGQQRCPNENFCCAPGDTCYRDASGNPRCSSGNLSISSSTSKIPTSTSQSSHSSKPSQSATIATPVSTSTSQPTICQLKSPQPRGFLSRHRRRSSMHPAQKRRD